MPSPILLHQLLQELTPVLGQLLEMKSSRLQVQTLTWPEVFQALASLGPYVPLL